MLDVRFDLRLAPRYALSRTKHQIYKIVPRVSWWWCPFGSGNVATIQRIVSVACIEHSHIAQAKPTPFHLIKSYRNWFSRRCAFHFICLFDGIVRRSCCYTYESRTFTNYNSSTHRRRRERWQNHNTVCVVRDGYLWKLELAVLCLIEMTFDSAMKWPQATKWRIVFVGRRKLLPKSVFVFLHFVRFGSSTSFTIRKVGSTMPISTMEPFCSPTGLLHTDNDFGDEYDDSDE